MKISTKLHLMTGGAILSLLLTGMIGLFIANGLNKSTENAYQKTLPSIQTAEALKFNIQALAIGLLKINMSTLPEQIPPLEKDVEKAKHGLLDALKTAGETTAIPALKEIVKKEEAIAATYFTDTEAMLTVIRNEGYGSGVERMNALASIRHQLTTLIEEHAQVVLDDAQKVAELAAAEAEQRLWTLAVLIALTSITIIGTNLYVGKNINKSLTLIQDAIGNIEGKMDFTTTTQVLSKDEVGIVSEALNRLMDKLRQSLTTIADHITNVTKTSETLSTASGEVAKAAEMQSDSATAMASSVEQMSVSITHVSDRSGDVHQFAEASGRNADTGRDAVIKMSKDIEAISNATLFASDKIRALDKSSAEVSAVVAVIKDVAEQTNLLALNAAIEAARAGDQGRGFAVVADEVRKLAERTAKSTVEIGMMIETIRSDSQEAVDSMTNAMDLVKQGVAQSRTTAELISTIGKESHETVIMVDEIRAALTEQRQASNLVASGIESIAQASEESSVAAKNTSHMANELDKLAHNVSEILGKYTLR